MEVIGTLENRELSKELLALYRRIQKETSYNPTAFAGMIAEHGGYETVRRLAGGKRATDGFIRLMALKKLELSVEVVLLSERWIKYFSVEDQANARSRLRELKLGDDGKAL